MLNRISIVVLMIAGMLLNPVLAAGSNVVKLGGNSKEKSIVSIGSVPDKKTIPINLGKLRTEHVDLPPLPLTQQERMALRAKHAAKRQAAVTNARRTAPKKQGGMRSKRSKIAKRNKEVAREKEQEVVLFDDSGEPVIE